MKKLLSLLSVLTISGTAVPTTIAASPYQKEEYKIVRNNKEIDENIDFIPLDLHRNKRNTETVTEDGYVYTLDGNNWEARRIDQEYTEIKNVGSYFFWNNDYFFTIDGEVYCKKNNVSQPQKIRGIYGKIKKIFNYNANVNKICFFSSNGYIYILENYNSLSAVRFDEYYNIPEIKNVNDFVFNDGFYFATDSGVYYKSSHDSPLYKIRGIYGKIKKISSEYGSGKYFLSEDGYVYYLNRNWWTAVRVDTYYNIPEIKNIKIIKLLYIYAESYGVYFVTNNGDVYYMTSSSWTPYKITGINKKIKEISLNSRVVKSSVYFLSEDGYVYYLSGTSWTAVRVDTYYNIPEIKNIKILQIESTNVFGGGAGVFFVTNKDIVYYMKPNSSTPYKITGIYGKIKEACTWANGIEFKSVLLDSYVKNTELGIIDDNSDKTILKVIKEKNLNFNFTSDYLYIVDKTSTSAKIIFRGLNNSNKNQIGHYVIVKYFIERDLNNTNNLLKEWISIFKKHIEDFEWDKKNWLPKHKNDAIEIKSKKNQWNREFIKLIHDLNQNIEIIKNNNYIKQLFSRVLTLENDLTNLKIRFDELEEKIANNALSLCSSSSGLISSISSSSKIVPVIGELISYISGLVSASCSLAAEFN